MIEDLASLAALIERTPPLPELVEHARARLDDDPGHDLQHALRVALWTLRIGDGELDPRHAIAAALFHDLVNLPKDDPDRHLASQRSAEGAAELLAAHGYAADEIEHIAAAIRDHSYSRGATPTTLLGQALQDADRLEALGVLGVFRTISTGTRLGGAYFHAEDPWAQSRPLDDRRYAIDHFSTKLLRLPATMRTERGRQEAERRAATMHRMLKDLGDELGHAWPGPAGDAACGPGGATPELPLDAVSTPAASASRGRNSVNR